jgi:hypothetical protein
MTRALPWGIAVLGTALLLGGVLLVVTGAPAPRDFGWTSYAPLPSSARRSELVLSFPDGTVLWTVRQAIGAGLAVLGLLVLVGLGGWLLGRRRLPR